MTDKLPVAVAMCAISERLLRADLIASHLVLQEALAQLIAELHAAGLVDGQRLCSRIEASLAHPQVVEQMPRVPTLAEDMLARFRQAIEEGASGA